MGGKYIDRKNRAVSMQEAECTGHGGMIPKNVGLFGEPAYAQGSGGFSCRNIQDVHLHVFPEYILIIECPQGNPDAAFSEFGEQRRTHMGIREIDGSRTKCMKTFCGTLNIVEKKFRLLQSICLCVGKQIPDQNLRVQKNAAVVSYIRVLLQQAWTHGTGEDQLLPSDAAELRGFQGGEEGTLLLQITVDGNATAPDRLKGRFQRDQTGKRIRHIVCQKEAPIPVSTQVDFHTVRPKPDGCLNGSDRIV